MVCSSSGEPVHPTPGSLGAAKPRANNFGDRSADISMKIKGFNQESFFVVNGITLL